MCCLVKDENNNGVLSVVLEVTMISCDCTGVPLYNEPIIVPVTVAFTTEDELKLFSSREAGLKTMVKDALRKANIDLEIGK